MRLEDSACPMLCTDDAGIVSNSAEALAKMIKIRFDHLRSGRPHGFGKKKEDHAAANTGACIPGRTVCHRSRGTNV